MRTIAALILVVLAAGTAHADDELLPTTSAVVNRHARSARRLRMAGGATLLVSGVALGVSGYLMADSAGDGFLSGIEKAYGYSMLAVGSLAAVGGSLVMIKPGEVEDMAEGITDEQDARYARTQIADNARRGRRTRMIVRGIGATLAGLGAVSTLGAVVGGDSLDRTAHNEMLGGGIALGLFGVGFLTASFVESRWESMHDELQTKNPLPLSAGIVPLRGGGALLGVAGTL